MFENDVPDEVAMRALGRELARRLHPGDVVLLEGALGVGKTTLVRGVLEGLGFQGSVRSPTFNLIQIFPTVPPVLHADLYRVSSHAGIGLEDYLDTHVCLIEWPDRATGLIDPEMCIQVYIEFVGSSRKIEILSPSQRMDS